MHKSLFFSSYATLFRKFISAQENNGSRSAKALSYLSALYDLERENREQELNPDEIKSLHLEKVPPVLQEMKARLDEESIKILPQSTIGQAFEYTLNLRTRLIHYVEDGRLQIDNNPVENTIRPIAVGRKNYMFAGSHEGARRAAIIYSLLEPAKPEVSILWPGSRTS